MNDETRGVNVLREAIEAVARDVERGGARRPRPRAARTTALAALGVAAAGAAIAWGLWLLRPAPTAEVEILELKVRGKTVRGVVLDDPDMGGLIVLPQIGGPPLASSTFPGGTP